MMKTVYKKPDYFDPAIPDSFQHKVQADLAMFQIEGLQRYLNEEPKLPIPLRQAKGTVKKELIFWVKHFIEHAGQLGHDTKNMEELLTKLQTV